MHQCLGFDFYSETQMEDSGKHGNNKRKFLNPWMLQFQKMGLELKCPLWFVILLSCILFLISSSISVRLGIISFAIALPGCRGNYGKVVQDDFCPVLGLVNKKRCLRYANISGYRSSTARLEVLYEKLFCKNWEDSLSNYSPE